MTKIHNSDVDTEPYIEVTMGFLALLEMGAVGISLFFVFIDAYYLGGSSRLLHKVLSTLLGIKSDWVTERFR